MVKSIRENFYEQSRAKEYSKKKHFLFSQREKSRSEELCKCLDSLFANHMLVWTRHAQLHPIEFCLLPMRPSPSIREMMMMMYNSFVKTQDDRFIMILSRQIRPDEHVIRDRWFFCAAAFADTFISVASFRAGKTYYIYIYRLTDEYTNMWHCLCTRYQRLCCLFIVCAQHSDKTGWDKYRVHTTLTYTSERERIRILAETFSFSQQWIKWF